MIEIILPVILILLGFASSFIATKYVIKSARARKILGKDMHKPGKPLVAERGGLGFALGFLVSAFLVNAVIEILYVPELYQLVPILYISSFAIIITALLGFMSDEFKFRWRTNTILPMLGAIPFLGLITRPSFTQISTSLGNWQLGPIGYLLALLFGSTGASNAVNMIAGYNGLEAGMTGIIVVGLGILAFLSGNYPVFLLAMLVLGSLLGFLYWNKYPARVFPGDIGTWSFGSSIFAISVLGKLEFWAVLMFALYFVNLVIFLLKRKYEKIEKFGEVTKDGRMYSRYGSSLTKWLAKRLRPKEGELVEIILFLQIIVICITIALFILW